MTENDDIRARDRLVDETSHTKSPRDRRWMLGIVILTFLLFITAGVAAVLAYMTILDQANKGATFAEQVRQACEDPTVNTRQLQREYGLCDNAADIVEEAPEPVEPSPGAQGDQGDPGPPPSDEQVARAVALHCATEGCRGRDGDNVTPAQVAAAVARYCNLRGQCQGPEGDQGVEGEEGQPGPPPTEVQVASAVTQYCSTRNLCQGPSGQKGDQGDKGEQGEQGTANPGTYLCPDGEFSRGFTVGPAGGVTLDCAIVPLFPGGGQNP